MAAVAPASDQASDLLQKLSLEQKANTHDTPEVNKKNTAAPEQSLTPSLQNVDPNISFYPSGFQSTPYYYGAYDSMNDWEDYSRYVNPDGAEMTPGVYGDMFLGYGYAPYGPYPSPGSPVPTMGHDGQLYGHQHYQYQAPYYQPPSPANAPYAPNQAPAFKGEVVVSTSTASDQKPISLDASKPTSNGVVANGTANGNSPQKPNQNQQHLSNGSYGRGSLLNGGLPSSVYQEPRYSYDGIRSPLPWFEFPDSQHRLNSNNVVSSTGSHVTNTMSGRNHLLPVPHLVGLHTPRPTSGPNTGMMNRMAPNNRMYSAYSTGLGFRSNFYDPRTNGRWGIVDNKYKSRGRGNGYYGYANEDSDGLAELNRGPRANRFKNQKGVVTPAVTLAMKGQNPTNANEEDSSLVPDRDQYNKADFAIDYSGAKFFVIKSYSEDDVHKSVKYNVWASTLNGNKKLDSGYQEAQGKVGGCPVFLFFSVNTSGQFVGVAEMVGPVDFDKTVDYWQQDKWNGCFPVKWHIVKDVPNSFLRHITLENNDNKPVTNSRDTQEVKLEQGLQMLKLFKEHDSKTSILDDFSFYEIRQKTMQGKRLKQQQLLKPVVDGKPGNAADEKDKDGLTTPVRLQNPLEPVTVLKKDTSLGLGERKPTNENGLLEKRVVSNGVANAC